MSERVEDGGPAYPHQFEDAEGHPRYRQSTGMSLRDACAIAALPATLAETWAMCLRTSSKVDNVYRVAAVAAYEAADAMLAARSPSEPLNARTQGVEVGR